MKSFSCCAPRDHDPSMLACSCPLNCDCDCDYCVCGYDDDDRLVGDIRDDS
jgi:hypothetical protein